MLVTTTKKYLQPKTISEALDFTNEYMDDFKYIAGGTDVVVNNFQGNEKSECFIDITGIEEMNRVYEYGEYLYIGSLVKLSELKNYPLIKNKFPLIPESAAMVGTPLIRNTATIGGNLLCQNRCYYYNQTEWWRESVGFCLKCDGDKCLATGTSKACYSEFISDIAPALICLNAEIEIIDINGEKRVKLEEIYSGDGVNPVNISKTGILKSILVPLGKDYRYFYKKLRQRESIEFTSLTLAITIDQNKNLKLTMSGVDPKPVIVIGTDSSDNAGLIKKAINGARSVENEMLSRKYRRKMISVFITEGLKKLAKNK